MVSILCMKKTYYIVKKTMISEIIDKKNQERYIDGFCAMLKSDKLKCTSIRQDILRIFFRNRYLTIKIIIEILENNYGTIISKASVYSTLKLLLSYKIIIKRISNVNTYYKLTIHTKNYNIVCSSCYKNIEFTDTKLIESVDLLAYKNCFKISDINMEIYGICNNCIDNQ